MPPWMIATTRAELAACHRLRAAVYERYYANIPGETFTDRYDDAVLPDGSPRAITLLVGSPTAPLGTARFVLGQPAWRCECEELTTFQPTSFFGDGRFADAGKFAVLPGTASLSVRQALCLGAAHVAQHWNLAGMVALLLPHVCYSLQECGVTLERVPNVVLRRDGPATLRYLLTYAAYFLPDVRWPSQQPWTTAELEHATLLQLQALAATSADGCALYRIVPMPSDEPHITELRHEHD